MKLLEARLCSLYSLLFICQKCWCHFILREVLSSTDQIWSYYTVKDDLDQPVLLPPRAWITGMLHDAQFIQCWVSNPEHLTASYPSYLQPSGEFISPVLAYSKSSGIRGSVGWKNSSVVSSACCSCRELEFSLQQMHGGSQSGPPVPGNLTPSFFCLHGHSMHTIHWHTHRQYTYTESVRERKIFF